MTALYEIVPVGGPRSIGDLRYATPTRAVASGGSEYGFVKIRYKLPNSTTSRLISTSISHASEVARFDQAPQDARFAASVAAFAELLRGGKYNGALRYDDVLRMAEGSRGDDRFGYRAEFLAMVRAAKVAAPLQSAER